MNSKLGHRHWHRRRRIAFTIGGVAVICLLAFLLALRHAPAWYRPLRLTDEQLRGARLDAMNTVDQIGDKLAARRPFDVTISEAQCNQWLSGLPQIWPDAARKLPRQISHPLVTFQPGVIHAAASLDTTVLRTIVSGSYQLAISPDKNRLRLHLVSAHTGALALPRFALASLSKRYLSNELSKEVSGEGDLSIENHFVWPNGRRPFRITAITVEPGQIRLTIEPL